MIQIAIDGVGLIASGIRDWTTASESFRAGADYVPMEHLRASANLLPPTERRRASESVRWTQPVGIEALEQAGLPRAGAAAVFASSSGNPEIVHQLCEALTRPGREVSPTRFHNSVHNTAAGYWAIATDCREASTSLAGYDGSFAAGLLEASTQAVSESRPLLLVAYDVPYPEPIRRLRPINAPFAVGLVLQPQLTSRSLASVTVGLEYEALPEPLENAGWESLRLSNPAARALPLLSAIARGEAARLFLEYRPHCSLRLDLAPC